MWAFKSSIYHFGTCFQHLSRHLTGPRPHYDLHQPRSWRGLDVLMKNVICHALTTTYTHASTTLVHAPAATGAIPLRYLTACSIMRSVRPIWSRHALATLLPRAYHAPCMTSPTRVCPAPGIIRRCILRPTLLISSSNISAGDDKPGQGESEVGGGWKTTVWHYTTLYDQQDNH